MQGWNWNSIFKQRPTEEPAEESPRPVTSNAKLQVTAEAGALPFPVDQPLASSTSQHEHSAVAAEAPSVLPHHLNRALQPLRQLQAQHNVDLASDQHHDANKSTPQQLTDDQLPATQQQLDEELQPLRERMQQRQVQLGSAKRRQQHRQRATPSKAPKLLSTPSPAQQQRHSPDRPTGGRSIADLQRFAFNATKQQRSPTGVASMPL